ncbi:MAG TPA: hypothetical protein VIL44_09465 [Micromonospora sp.]
MARDPAAVAASALHHIVAAVSAHDAHDLTDEERIAALRLRIREAPAVVFRD